MEEQSKKIKQIKKEGDGNSTGSVENKSVCYAV
jgi:hypothetical protein